MFQGVVFMVNSRPLRFLSRVNRYSTRSTSSGSAKGPLLALASISGAKSLNVIVTIACIMPSSDSSVNANKSFCWCCHHEEDSGIVLGIVVPKCRLNASGSSVDGPGRPLFRLLKFEWKRRVLIRQSSFQKAQRAVLRNQLCIKVALFRACAAGEPLPTSERSLPVP